MALTIPLLALLVASAGTSATTSPDPSLPEDVPVEQPQWTGALTLGASWTDGNTETLNVNGTFNAQRRGESDRWTLDAFVNYGETTSTVTGLTEETTNNSGGGAKYDYFYSSRTYFFGSGSAKVDHVADLDLRAILGVGAGYQWKETEKIKWGTEAGLSYVDEDFGDDTFDADFLAARLASNLSYQISPTSSFMQVAEVLPSLEDSEDLIAKLDNRLKMTITGKWIAQVQYVLDFDGSVPTGSGPGPDGNEETDHRIVFSVGWSFGS